MFTGEAVSLACDIRKGFWLEISMEQKHPGKSREPVCPQY
uniref:Uncharacterized protein n=1 Tax=Anguilla anguilla TaxID=7936 RepID=A0A0E9SQS7_ANGAN